MKQKLLGICMMLIMLCPIQSAFADVANGTCGTNLSWKLSDDGTLTISGTGEMIKMVSTTVDYPWYSLRTSVLNIVVEEGVTSIGDFAFYGTNAYSVIIPSTIKHIGGSAFKNCKMVEAVYIANLENWCQITFDTYHSNPANISGRAKLYLNGSLITELCIPNTISSWSQYAFDDWRGVTSLIIPSSVQSMANINLPDLENVTINSSRIISQNYTTDAPLYSYFGGKTQGSKIKKLIIGDDIISIGNHTFNGCSGLNSVTLGNSIKYIGDHAFRNCSSLSKIEMPNSVTSIGYCAFLGCTSLADVTLGDNVITIDESSFNKCPITSIHLGNSVRTIGQQAFANTKLTSVIIPNSVTSLSWGAFERCEELETVTLGNSLQGTGRNTFQGCSRLKNVIMPNTMTEINPCAFQDCIMLSSIVLPESLTVIGASAFSGCAMLKSISIPETCENIYKDAFQGCSQLKEVTSKSTVPPTILSNSFDTSTYGVATLKVPAVALETYKNTAYWKNFSSIEPMNIVVTDITLNVTSASLKIGEVLTLATTVVPEDAANKNVTWSSSDMTVATVENGVVTALTTGTTTITATTTDGTDLSASCVVTVSSDASDETTDLEPSTDISVYPNILYFNDVENKAGDFNLKLNMKCAEENITAFQCDVYLPEGVTWKSTTDKRGNLIYKLPTFNEERTDDSYHTIAPIAQNTDGSYNIIVYSMDLEPILETDGILMTLPLEISEDMEAADYNLFIRNIVLTDIDQKEVNIAQVVSRLTIPSYEIGDANGDGGINITDIVAVIAYIRGNAGENFIFAAADVNADGVINITDIVGIISIIRNGGASAKSMNAVPAMAAAPKRTADNLEVIPFTVAEGATSATVQLDMNNPGKEFTAFQCDIVLPEGIEWASTVDRRGNKKYTAPTFNEDAERTDASYHTVDVGLMADGSMNIIVYSTDMETFLEESGAILDMPFTFAEGLAPGVYDITVKNIVMTTPEQSQVKPEDYTFSVLVGSPAERAVALKGNFNDEAISSYNAALAGNTVVSAIDLTEAVEVSENTAIATGNENLLVYVAEDMAVKNAVNVVKGDECASLVLTDGSDFCAPKAFTASSAIYERALAAEWGTVMLPYTAQSNEAVQYYTLTEADLENGVLTFEEAAGVEANTPAVFKASGASFMAKADNAEIEETVATEATCNTVGGLTLTGTLAKTALSGLDPEAASGVYYIKDNKFWRGNGTLNIPAFRAYFDASVAGAKALTIFEGEGTDISGISADSEIKVYTIDGKQMNNNIKSLAAGMYIVNDKKIIIKK